MVPFIGIDAAIIMLVEQLLPRFSPQENVLLIHLRVDLKTKNKEHTDLFDILFWRPGTYTLVGYKKSDKVLTGEYEGEYQKTLYHDSAWKDDGFRFLNYDRGTKIDFVVVNEIKVGTGTIEFAESRETFQFIPAEIVA
jgi:hypothetical protein